MLVVTQEGKIWTTSMRHWFIGLIAIHIPRRYMAYQPPVGRHIGSFCISICQSCHEGPYQIRVLPDFTEGSSNLFICPSWEIGTGCELTTNPVTGEFRWFPGSGDGFLSIRFFAYLEAILLLLLNFPLMFMMKVVNRLTRKIDVIELGITERSIIVELLDKSPCRQIFGVVWPAEE